MELIKDIFNNIFNLSKIIKDKHMYSDFIALSSSLIKKHYMLLSPTEKNVQFAKSLKDIYPSSVINDDVQCRKNRSSICLTNFIEELMLKEFVRNEPSAENVYNRLKDEVIIVKKDENTKGYLESLNVGSMISDNRKYILKQIKFSERDWYSGELSIKISESLSDGGKNGYEFMGFSYQLNMQGNTVAIRGTCKTHGDFNADKLNHYFKTVEGSRALKREINRLFDDKLVLPYVYSNKTFSKPVIILPIRNRNKVKTKCGRPGVIFLRTQDVENQNIVMFTSVRGISIDDFYNHVTKVVLNI